MDTIVMTLVRTNSNFTDQVSQKKKNNNKKTKTKKTISLT